LAASTGKYAIDLARLAPVGVSFAAPAASNKTQAGRAQTQRVELVERGYCPRPTDALGLSLGRRWSIGTPDLPSGVTREAGERRFRRPLIRYSGWQWLLASATVHGNEAIHP